MPSNDAPIPVHVLTGFLGSGKTTLLNRLLRSAPFADAAVLINEFGAVAIDHLLVREAREELVVLESGCICCTLRKDLVEQLSGLIAQRARGEIPRFSRVVIETTGLADPAPIVQTLVSQPPLRDATFLAGVVCTVDAQLGLATLQQHPLAQKQISVSDRLLLTKLDLADLTQLPALEGELRALNPSAPITRVPAHADVAQLLLAAVHLDTRDVLFYPATPEHVSRVSQLAVTLPTPVDFRDFSLWVSLLTQLWASRVLRLKAVISAHGEPTPIAVQAVQHVVYPPLNLPSMPELAGKSHVVVLVQDLTAMERTELEASLHALAT